MHHQNVLFWPLFRGPLRNHPSKQLLPPQPTPDLMKSEIRGPLKRGQKSTFWWCIFLWYVLMVHRVPANILREFNSIEPDREVIFREWTCATGLATISGHQNDYMQLFCSREFVFWRLQLQLHVLIPSRINSREMQQFLGKTPLITIASRNSKRNSIAKNTLTITCLVCQEFKLSSFRCDNYFRTIRCGNSQIFDPAALTDNEWISAKLVLWPWEPPTAPRTPKIKRTKKWLLGVPPEWLKSD